MSAMIKKGEKIEIDLIKINIFLLNINHRIAWSSSKKPTEKQSTDIFCKKVSSSFTRIIRTNPTKVLEFQIFTLECSSDHWKTET